jgi:hypothetical protein
LLWDKQFGTSKQVMINAFLVSARLCLDQRKIKCNTFFQIVVKILVFSLKWIYWLIQHGQGFCHTFRVLKLRDLPSGRPRTAIVLLELMFVKT